MASRQLTPASSREALDESSTDSAPATPLFRRRRSSLISKNSSTDRHDLYGDDEADQRRVDSPVERFGKDGRRLGKEERLEDSKIRERLKIKKDTSDKRSRGPVIAKPNVLNLGNSTSGHSSGTLSPTSTGRLIRTPSPTSDTPPFSQQSLCSTHPCSPISRRRSSSISSLRNQSSSSNGRRTPSPGSGDCGVTPEAAEKRVEKANRARLYLLQQTGPNSLLIGGDSPDHKFRVIIGPQTCNCGKGQHCIHLLFVMLRVFQIHVLDPILWRRTLKNYEVEMLFRKYHERRDSRCSFRKKKKVRRPKSLNQDKESETRSSQESLLSDFGGKDEEEICSICLLEMIDGESLVTCERSCHNRLHHHCIAIWFEECKTQGEPLICPLCRTEWSLQQLNDRDTESTDERAQSPLTESPPGGDFLPHAETIPDEHLSLAAPWIEVFGEELVSCLFSRDWVTREAALHHLNKRMTSQLVPGPWISPPGSQKACMIETCCHILSVVIADPVYKVFVATLKCLRTMLGNIMCGSSEEISWLEKILNPILETLLLKCADSNRKTCQLSTSTLLELAKGQDGELAIGRKINPNESKGLDGMAFLVNCIVQQYSTNSVQWQWLLGRLSIADKLIEHFPSHFILRPQSKKERNLSDSGVEDPTQEVPTNYHRLMTVLTFALSEANNPHIKIGKLARRVFVLGARLTAHVTAVFQEVESMLSSLDRSLQQRLKKRLSVVSSDFTVAWDQEAGMLVPAVAQQVAAHVHKEPSYENKHSQPRRNSDSRVTSPATPPTRRRSVSRHRSQIPRPVRQTSQSGDDTICPEHPPPSTPKSRPKYTTIKKSDSKENLIEETNNNYKKSFYSVASTTSKNSHSVSLPRCPNGLMADDWSACLSPSTPEDKLVSFKSEVANSPKRIYNKSPLDALAYHGNGKLCCKEEIQLEEAKALAAALEASERQERLPIIPGLTRAQDEEVVGIRIQPDSEEEEKTCSKVYMEGKQWVKGILLGTGAFSSCYQARDVRSGTIMAVKQMAYCRNSQSEQEKVVETIKEEIDMMTRLNHPNVLRILGATQEGCHFNTFIEWMAGGSVSYILTKYGAFSDHVITNYTEQLLRGLAYLHDNQILHRDLKGANLLVNSTGQQIRIADFGAAGRLATNTTMVGEFKGQLLGTIAFMAPEVLQGQDYGRTCDIWSVGCVMIEMATCKPPWNASDLTNHLALIFKIASATKPPPIPEHLAPPIRDLMLRCLEQNPEDRPSAKELLQHALFTNYCL